MKQWCPSSSSAPGDPSLIDLFDEQARLHADRVAIASGGVELTYASLDRHTNRVAHLLRRIGAGRGQIVAILMERGIAAVTAILGVLKAGAAYLPIDPSCPADRARDVVRRSRPHAVLTTSELLHRSETGPESFVVLLDELLPFQRPKKRSGRVFDALDIQSCSGDDLPGVTHAGDLAYVIFTSGSTAVPKGVMVEHRSVVNLARWATSTFDITHRSRVSQIYSLAFDPSVQEIFSALLGGATLVPVPEEIRTHPSRFLHWLKDSAISHWDTVPSLWYQIVDQASLQAGHEPLVFPHLETLLLGGEALHGDKVRSWMSCVEQNHRIYNVYGPTECAVSATYFAVSSTENSRIVPIGRPIPNMEAYLLDEERRPCPPGVEGEIYLCGVGVARGYLDAPELTEAAFAPGLLPGQRFYRTGDFGRRLPDGTIEYLRRRDDQVKVRGCRVELGEIDAALRDCPGLNEVVVVATDDRESYPTKIIAMYTSDAPVTPDWLRRHVKEKLPDFMVPHHIVRVASFPLTPNGKIDRRALLDLALAPESRRSGIYRPPTTGTEVVLARIWERVLDLDRVGTDDDFFSLGGDSLSTVLIQQRCEREGIQLRSTDIFQHPTIRDLARHVDESTLSGAGTHPPGDAAVTSPKGSRGPPPHEAERVLPLSGLQVKMCRAGARSGGGAHLPQVILRCEGSVDLAALEESMNVLIARHEALRMVVRADPASGPVLIVQPGARYRLSVEDLSTLPPSGVPGPHPPAERGRDIVPRKHRVGSVGAGGAPPSDAAAAAQERYVERAADAALERGFDLSRWPLFELVVYKLSPSRFDIVWTIHHILMDGWSTSIFHAELSQIYPDIVAGRARSLLPLRASLSDVIEGARSRSAGEARRFWERHLAGATFAKLPADLAPREGGPRRIESFDLVVPENMTQALRRFARQRTVTLNTVSLSAFYLFLRELTHQDDVTAGVVTSGRDGGLAGTEGVIGNLIRLVPLRLDLARRQTFGGLVRLVQDTISGMLPHDHLDLAEIAGLVGHDVVSLPLEAIFVSEGYPSPAELGLSSFGTFSVTGITARENNGHPLTVVSSEDANRMVLGFEYDAGLFKAETVRGWAWRFLSILKRVEQERIEDGVFQ